MVKLVSAGASVFYCSPLTRKLCDKDQAEHEERRLRKRAGQDSDAEAEVKSAGAKAVNLGNAAFEPARILVNPHCLTTYGGVSHTKLALELFGQSEDDEDDEIGTSPAHKHGYLLRDDEWRPAPETFVCQEVSGRFNGLIFLLGGFAEIGLFLRFSDADNRRQIST